MATNKGSVDLGNLQTNGVGRPVVIKVGGSLYDDPKLPELVGRLTARHSNVLLVPGGGKFADVVRGFFERDCINETQAHWLAIRSMDLAADYLRHRLGIGTVIVDPREILGENGRVALLAPSKWLEVDAGRSLPIGWNVTSDSIAAFIAKHLTASLILCKSVGDEDVTMELAQQNGWVDEYFSLVAAGMEVQWINGKTGTSTVFCVPGVSESVLDIGRD